MAFDNLKSSESVLMEDILTENVFDSKLGSQNDSTDLFDCLVPEKNGDNESVEKDELRTDESCCTDEKDDVPIVSASLESSDVISSLVEGTGVQSVDDTSEINDSAENHSAPSVKTEYTLNSDEIKTNDDKDFVPTIVDIFGAGSEPMKQSSVDVSCNDTETESKNELPRVSIDDVQGSFKDLNANNHEKEKCEDSVVDNSPVIPVHTIDDDSQDISKTKETNDDTKSDTLLNDNVVIKQEPQDEEIDNDCMLVDADDVGTCFTSEIEIKEERPNSCENEDSEVFCIETTSQIPQPIPIKIEANFETDKEISSPKSASESTCSSTKTRTKSDADSTDERAKPSVAKSFTVVGYKCHLCDTSFKEHELLNEHMRLHRNNSLAERYRRTYGKQRKPSKYVCRSCGKRLSTGQSLAQHTMIHNNEKPHICPICKKDFRHLSNFKMHVQKHKEEEELRRKERDRQRLQARIVTTTADRSVARSADFGRLVGPLFVKETLLSKTPVATPKVERKAFDLKFPRARDNAKENMVFYQKANASYDESYTRARKFQDDIGDDVIPLKTFNNVDNIVMNATKFIVKVDNLDPNVLKRKIKTPDISIDKSALENKPPDRKRRVMLSPADGAKRVKLDQIENIIMDASTEGANDATVDYSYADDYDYDDDDNERCDAPKQEMLTDNELFELLNDDESSRPESNLVQGVASASPTKSNVIVLKNAVKTSPSDASHKSEAHASSFSQYMAEKSKEKIDSDKLSELTAVSERSCGEDDEPDKCDIYDRAFHNVALRRLTLIRRKAAENGGKVEDKYLLGPLFWRKAVQKAQNNQLQTEPTMSLNEAKLAYKRLNAFKFGKLDTRRTNDPAKLQQRAELKLQFVLDRVKAMTDLSHVNLAGPLYWKRTLKLAGIHSPADLKRLSVQSDPSIGDVQFVKSDEIAPKGEVNGCDAVTVNERVLDEAVILDGAHVAKPASHSVAVQASDFLENVVGNRLTTSCEADHTMVDSMLNDDLLKPTKLEYSAANAGVTDVPNVGAKDTRTETKAESILYDSLTKPKSSKHEAVSANEPTKSRVPVKSKSSISVPVKPTPSSTLRNRISTPSSSSARSHSTRQPAATAVVPEQAKVCDTNAIERYKVDVSKAIPVTTNVPIDAEVAEAAIDGGNIILNVDSADFQLIADSKGENGEETNYVLVSDGSGGVQLIKENDLQLVEDEATNTQYVVNMQGENFANFNINGEQLTYAIQLDGENYTTLQFVPDGVPLEGATKERIIGGEKTVTIDGTNYVIADAGADLNHIGKELSDFLHIDYGSLLKSENEDQQA